MTGDTLRSTIVPLLFLFSTTLFIFGIKRLAKVKTARQGNSISAAAMAVAVGATLLDLGSVDYQWIIGGVVVGTLIGAVAAQRVAMTSMPEMVAIFNGFGGAASALVALSAFWGGVVEPGTEGTVASVMGGAEAITTHLSILIGALTLTGSFVAYLKLQGKLNKGKPVMLPGRHAINFVLLATALAGLFWFSFGADTVVYNTEGVIMMTGIALLLGVLLVIPIGGADMPVVVSLLNSYSGVAASAAGFVIGNPLLIIGGAMVGASGLILTQIMCVAMNRSLLNVLVGGFGGDNAGGSEEDSEYHNVKNCGPEEAAMLLENASSVIFVPGYGLAVAQAQHTTRELADLLKSRGVKVQYAIHPVAGRMPGHMNVLLAEADVPYEELVEMDTINPEFRNTDVAIILGANDVVNPAAVDNPSSPIAGMPILMAHEARTVFVVKRSLGAGYAGIKNTLFEGDNTMMIFGDAKKVLQGLINEVKEL